MDVNINTNILCLKHYHQRKILTAFFEEDCVNKFAIVQDCGQQTLNMAEQPFLSLIGNLEGDVDSWIIDCGVLLSGYNGLWQIPIEVSCCHYIRVDDHACGCEVGPYLKHRRLGSYYQVVVVAWKATEQETQSLLHSSVAMLLS